jgi:hypothetical protein
VLEERGASLTAERSQYERAAGGEDAASDTGAPFAPMSFDSISSGAVGCFPRRALTRFINGLRLRS